MKIGEREEIGVNVCRVKVSIALTPSALRLNLLVVDPSEQYETGDRVTWSNKLVLRNKLSESGGKRSVELFVAPIGNIRYTLDGSEPRDGTAYEGPIAIGDGEVLLSAFAEADGLEAERAVEGAESLEMMGRWFCLRKVRHRH